MKEFIDKLIERIVNTPTKCLNEFSVGGADEKAIVVNGIEYGCASRQHEIIDMINELAEEFSANTPQKSATISKMETVGWIPVSKKLPEVNGWYLVTNTLGVVQQQHWGANHLQKLNDKAVIAWMPLPAPYTEGE